MAYWRSKNALLIKTWSETPAVDDAKESANVAPVDGVQDEEQANMENEYDDDEEEDEEEGGEEDEEEEEEEEEEESDVEEDRKGEGKDEEIENRPREGEHEEKSEKTRNDEDDAQMEIDRDGSLAASPVLTKGLSESEISNDSPKKPSSVSSTTQGISKPEKRKRKNLFVEKPFHRPERPETLQALKQYRSKKQQTSLMGFFQPKSSAGTGIKRARED